MSPRRLWLLAVWDPCAPGRGQMAREPECVGRRRDAYIERAMSESIIYIVSVRETCESLYQQRTDAHADAIQFEKVTRAHIGASLCGAADGARATLTGQRAGRHTGGHRTRPVGAEHTTGGGQPRRKHRSATADQWSVVAEGRESERRLFARARRLRGRAPPLTRPAMPRTRSTIAPPICHD